MYDDEKTAEREQDATEQGEELMVLQHEAVPGYRTAFYVVFAIGLLYLLYIIIAGGKG
ncbi:MAG: hypothetical protein ACNA74_02790 [Desulfurivibrio sp.]